MFVELFSKTNYSFLEGASHPEELIIQASHLGFRHLGITDRNGVYGIPRAHVAAKKTSVSLIVGAEVTLAEGGTVSLLAKNREGYGDLCALLTRLHCEFEEKLPAAELFSQCENLFVCLPVWSIDTFPALELKNAFPKNIYLLATLFMDGNDAYSKEMVLHHSKKLEIPCVATNLPLFHDLQRKPLQDVLTCIQHTCTLKTAGFRLQPNAERRLKSAKEMELLFRESPDWLENSLFIAEQCRFSLDEIRYHYPDEWLPPGETGDTYLEKLTWIGAEFRYGKNLPDSVVAQLKKELILIRELDYSDYFLTIWDITQFALKQKILFQGRGSAANSIVCYVLGITAIDPIRMELLFERFLSRERAEPPDIDIDFEHERREEVIQYIYQRYGRMRAAITAEVICFRRKSSFREVGKVFSMPAEVIDRLLVLTHRRDLGDLPWEEIPKVAPEIDVKWMKLFYSIAMEIWGFPRHLGTHVGGFVLCQDLLSRNVPIEKAAMPDRTIVQWDKNDLDALGFVRVDILGLGILTCLKRAFDFIEKVHGVSLSLATIPAEDPKVYESFSKGDTVGVFQIESRAQMNMLPRLKPRTFFDLVVEISLVRPGPIQGDMVHPYLRRRAGLEKTEYAHPDLKAILGKTYGVPLFQEQIMKMAMVVAGFSAGEADELRRAMGTWRRSGKNRLSEMGAKFCQGLLRKGISQDFAERIFSQIEGFAEYGFPESHAASFALIAYASGFLRLYYPDAYLAAILNAQPMGFYQSHSLIHDGERHGVQIRPIDIGISVWDNQVEEKGFVRLGFREIKGFAKRTYQALLKARDQAPFTCLEDVALRMREALSPIALTKRDLFLLAGANAFDRFGISRREAFWQIQALPLQDSLWLTVPDQVSLPKEKEWERITLDFDAQRVSLHAHPMSHFRRHLDEAGALSSRAFQEESARFIKNGRKIKVAGLVICRQMPPTASGVLFITLEDEFGFMNLVIWNKVYQQYREALITQSFLIVEGKAQKPDDAQIIHVIVEKAQPLFQTGQLIKSHDWN